ncbi:IMP dehydrogenase [Sulfuriferula plumbiphila]|uniref:IMP dehydrogenase n=1 Tax=Sulfuriferula plumbiphila TaxID=171865 RepID=A0A512L8T0_9PROT|nr:transglutaminase family protein [Sulfuriferula plumbiphila]BBP04294.1 IMP dehydrogenase [Sulfuriferula plumbiphila]GEP30877.1 IMP dehydrogenase [Sulfuriferula plumbiphila]
MTIRVALHHHSRYRFDRPVMVFPHEIRLRPAAHNRTPISAYSLKVQPAKHFIHWQQDAYGNFVARLTFPEPTRELEVTVDLVADMTVINPFDFFVEPWAEHYPFQYPAELKAELTPFLQTDTAGTALAKWLVDFRRALPADIGITNFLVRTNQRIHRSVSYLIRMEPGVQNCEETLTKGSGSCRDSAWLLVQALRHLGIAARFVSGYLIQLAADAKPLDGPAGPSADFTDLHAWCEAYIPGAGWVGLDATSGLLAGEGHIPLAATAQPASAAPINGLTGICEAQLDVTMTVTRIHEDPRVTKPYTDAQWQAAHTLGLQIDAELKHGDVRLTQGGEPTFVSIDNMDGAEWNIAALGEEKWTLANALIRRLQARFASGSVLHFGQGKWYPGEALPRWALTAYWRADGTPLWHNPALVAEASETISPEVLKRFATHLAQQLGLNPGYLIPAYEDPWQALDRESRLPANLDPHAADLTRPDARHRLAQQLRAGLAEVVGYVLPLKAGTAAAPQWRSSRWPLRQDRLYLVAGDSALGYRLPLDSLPWLAPEDFELELPPDPFAERAPLPESPPVPKPATAAAIDETPSAREVIHTALALQVRDGILHVCMPPTTTLEAWLALVSALEHCAAALARPIRMEGYAPPRDPRLVSLSVTPDPGVIEVNIHPAADWPTLVERTRTLYEDARQTRLGSEKFMLDGRHTGTGGGNHVTLGGATAADSPFLRRPDLLKSLIAYWQQHPAMSYLFSGQFIGPTSQAPRVDEARDDNLYELEIAFQQMDAKLTPGKESGQPWLVDRLLRNLLIDLTGNTHRAEFCIDKLYAPDSATGRLGLVELRAFEMPPHYRMSLVQSLLLRALLARFWKTPYQGKLVYWDTALHDRFMLPHFIEQDMRDISRDLRVAGYAFDDAWFSPFIEFRFPRYGSVAYQGIQLELRQAIEPWHVLGEEMATGGMARYVDSSVERMQVKVSGMIDSRHQVACNGRPLPLHPTGVPGEFVAAVRFKAWAPPSALHPAIGIHAPLVFDVVDSWNGRAIGGCTYHVSHPGGRNYDTFPVNANEAEARRRARFWDHGHSAGTMAVEPEALNPRFPMTLDLRWQPK